MTEKQQNNPEINNLQETLSQSIVEEVKGVEESRKEFPDIDELLKVQKNQEFLKSLSLDTFLDFELNESEKEKVSEILNRWVIEKTSPIDIEIWDRVYQDIDDYSPPIDNESDNTEKLKEIVNEYREKSIFNWLNNGSDTSNQINYEKIWNEPEENEKISKIIMDIYNEYYQEINNELWITDITQLTPSQATKLAGLITMTKLDYDYWQAISPQTNHLFFDWLPENEKVRYKKEYFISLMVGNKASLKSEFVNLVNDKWILSNASVKEKWYELYNSIKSSISDDMLENISGMNLDEIIEFANNLSDEREWWLPVLDFYSWYLESKEWWWIKRVKWRQHIVANLFYSEFSEFWDEHEENDNKVVSTLLKDWKWICRNYANANEAVFEALKSMQNPDNNKLKNSLLLYYDGNELNNNELNSKIAETEEGSNSHAWNVLITIWKDWKKNISQIDTTHADWSWNEWWIWDSWFSLDKVRTLDRTFDRFINEMADNLSDKTFNEIWWNIIDFISELELEWWNEKKVDMMMKLAQWYFITWDKEWKTYIYMINSKILILKITLKIEDELHFIDFEKNYHMNYLYHYYENDLITLIDDYCDEHLYILEKI